MANKPQTIRPGEVEITLKGWGRPLVLVPSIDAGRKISRRYGGLTPAVQRVGFFDFDAYVHIIAAGAQVTDAGMERLETAVFDTGLIGLAAPLTKFLTLLGSGGRPVDEVEETPDPSLG